MSKLPLQVMEEEGSASSSSATSERPRDKEERRMKKSSSISQSPDGNAPESRAEESQPIPPVLQQTPSVQTEAARVQDTQMETEPAGIAGATNASTESPSPAKRGKKRVSRQTKKDPKAPKRFKSSYIFYAQTKYKEIERELAEQGITNKSTVDITKMVSSVWRGMSDEEKRPYEELSKKDKARFEVERAMYKGSWTVPVGHKRTQALGAPKRPESAFLAFSNKKRASLKLKMPKATNGDISKMLAKMWSEAPDDVRRKYQDDERRLREKYKVAVDKWRAQEDAQLKEREEHARKLSESGEGIPLTSLDGSDRGGSDEKMPGGAGQRGKPKARQTGRKRSPISMDSSSSSSPLRRLSNEAAAPGGGVRPHVPELRQGQSSAITTALREVRSIASTGGERHGATVAPELATSRSMSFRGSLQGSLSRGIPGQSSLLPHELDILAARYQGQHQLLLEAAMLDPRSRLALSLSDPQSLRLDPYAAALGGAERLYAAQFPLTGAGLYGVGHTEQALRASQLAAIESERRLRQLAASSEIPDATLSQLAALHGGSSETIAMLRHEQRMEDLVAASAAQRQQLVNEQSLYGTSSLNSARVGIGAHEPDMLSQARVQGRPSAAGADAHLLTRAALSGSLTTSSLVGDASSALGLAKIATGNEERTSSPTNLGAAPAKGFEDKISGKEKR